MSVASRHHRELTNGEGKCSVPMWTNGLPNGFCDAPAYGERPPGKQFRTGSGELIRWDGKYNGFVPGLACAAHGGPPPCHHGDPCAYCGVAHADVSPGPCSRELVGGTTEPAS